MIESDWDKLCDHTDELMTTGRYPGRATKRCRKLSAATRNSTRPRPA
jgi:hypothetical protein